MVDSAAEAAAAHPQEIQLVKRLLDACFEMIAVSGRGEDAQIEALNRLRPIVKAAVRVSMPVLDKGEQLTSPALRGIQRLRTMFSAAITEMIMLTAVEQSKRKKVDPREVWVLVELSLVIWEMFSAQVPRRLANLARRQRRQS